jgi:excisionase family DNA binding protein
VLLDIAGVAERLSVTERFVRRLIFERRIPFLKIGHFVRFEPAEIERWITETRVPERTRR